MESELCSSPITHWAEDVVLRLGWREAEKAQSRKTLVLFWRWPRQIGDRGRILVNDPNALSAPRRRNWGLVVSEK